MPSPTRPADRSTNSGEPNNWVVTGGTGASAPTCGLFARAGHLSAVDGPGSLHPAPADDFTDITNGNDEACHQCASYPGVSARLGARARAGTDRPVSASRTVWPPSEHRRCPSSLPRHPMSDHGLWRHLMRLNPRAAGVGAATAAFLLTSSAPTPNTRPRLSPTGPARSRLSAAALRRDGALGQAPDRPRSATGPSR